MIVRIGRVIQRDGDESMEFGSSAHLSLPLLIDFVAILLVST
jgi:hypothetical protein